MQFIYRLGLLILLLVTRTAAHAQNGCTDPLATNYSSAATHNDGSCAYPATTLQPTQLGVLSDTIKETSGLIYWNGNFWTHNDDTDTLLYAIDTTDGHIVKRIAIAGAVNHDWEEITQDNNYIYIGDFGNNANGNRTNLVILRIAKSAILAGQTSVTPDKIFFSYADQSSFTATGSNNTDFDCESFLATDDSLYLFNKQWISGKSKIYVLPKTPGTYSAVPVAEFNVDGLITGATYIAAKKAVVLCGYKKGSSLYQPFVYLLYDYSGNSFFSGNKRRILINPLLYQTEGIATIDGKRFFISNEDHSPVQPTLRVVDFSPYLDGYYHLNVPEFTNAPGVSLYPNPAQGNFNGNISAQRDGSLYAITYNALGQTASEEIFSIHSGSNELKFENALAPGLYWVKMIWEGKMAWGKIMVNR